ncbi:MAG: IS4 family transposase [Planctomycetaceae bacterium]
MVTIGGRHFTSEVLERITQTSRDQPALSRRGLSRQVCEWLGWRNAAGKLQEMSCRKAMLELERRGLVQLPAVTRQFAFQRPRTPLAPPPIGSFTGELADLGAIEIVPVRSQALSALWRGMMDAHHYLGSGPLCGAQLRYLVRSERAGWIGGASYSASARRVACRDAWIGWSEESLSANRNLVVNNSRFLIAPSVRVPNLASHVLSRLEKQLADDWDRAYAYRPVLLETYVEQERFSGTCYRAAGWSLLGTTSARGRQGTGTSVKRMFVKPLVDDWQATLCRTAAGTIVIRDRLDRRPPRNWIEAELGGAELGDARLTARLLEMTGRFYDKPTANIPQACGSAAEAKAAYRFLDNEAVQWEAILKPHFQATEQRVGEERLVLVPQDTTALNYSTHTATTGLGKIGHSSESVVGLMLHDTIALSAQGTPLGLLDARIWARPEKSTRHERHERPIAEKESDKWLQSYRAVSAVQDRCRKTRLVVMADRESDIHDLFVERGRHSHAADLLIRADRGRNRRVADGDEPHELLWSSVGAAAVVGVRELLVPPGENRVPRLAMLEVRSRAVTLVPPQRKPDLPPVEVHAVLARETAPPEGAEPIEWMLLSTVPVDSKADAFERLDWYARRWAIEVYHRILKSGCRVEQRQLATSARLSNCLAIDMVVAWRIHHLTMLGQETPDVACTVSFTDSEWKALTTFVSRKKDPPPQPPSLTEAVRLLGKLGGHLGRKGDGEPGSEVLWRGMARLTDIEYAYSIYH